jgi:glycosyltransferase involved in cell wall biosynthesis
MSDRKEVVIVGMLNSIHLARWVTQFASEPVDFVLIPSTPFKTVHPLILKAQEGSKRAGATYELVGHPLFHSKLIWLADRLFGLRLRGRALAKILGRRNPDFLHVLELQNAGYLVLDALVSWRKFKTEIILTNYGSDIYWFQQFPGHLTRIKALLSIANRYSAECERDVDLALDYGFQGRVLPVIPNAGGFPVEELSRTTELPKARETLMIKGYDGWVGRARLALEAVDALQDELRDYEIVVYSADRTTLKRVASLKKSTGLRISVFKKNSISHDQMMAKFRQAKLYIGISLSDGISTSLLEALVSGCIPIQTSTACTERWFDDGVEGVVVRDFEVQTIVSAIRSGMNIADKRTREDLTELQSKLSGKLSERNVFQLARTYYEA